MGPEAPAHNDTVTLMPPLCGLVTKLQELQEGVRARTPENIPDE